jgi:hypothetical protein
MKRCMMRQKDQSGVILKIDFEKPYNKVKWSFVKQTLLMKGFSQIWCKWIEACTQNGHVRIKINNQTGGNFVTKKGLRHGDPLSLILFNIVADMLTILINQVKHNGQIDGVVPRLVDNGLSILQYADGTLILWMIILRKLKT